MTMQKITLSGILFSLIPLLAYGNPYEVKPDGKVPIFTSQETTLEYEKSAKGTECSALDTVLLPGEQINILDLEASPIIPVEYLLGKRVLKGYIHQDFLENIIDTQANKPLQQSKAKPLSMKECDAILKRCLDEQVPYCWGGNNFEAIPLPADYRFTTKSADENPDVIFELRGFDCSGILHYISNGTLPHCTKDLKDAGQIVRKFDCSKAYPTWQRVERLSKLKSLDYILLLTPKGGHVLVIYNGGLFEFRDIKSGCTFTPRERVLERFNELFDYGKRAGKSEIYFITWHPEAKAYIERRPLMKVEKAKKGWNRNGLFKKPKPLLGNNENKESQNNK